MIAKFRAQATWQANKRMYGFAGSTWKYDMTSDDIVANMKSVEGVQMQASKMVVDGERDMRR
jgi:hypothetical protein